MTFRFVIVAALLFSFVIALFARGPVELKKADQLTSSEENGVKRQQLDGNVWIVKDSLNIHCEHAVYYADSGILIFNENVEFRDPKRTLFADHVRYNEHTEEVEASGKIRIYQDTLAITSERATYRERFKSGYFYDKVRIRYDSRNLILTGNLAFFDHEHEYARMVRDPVLTERDSANKITTEIIADTIEYFGDRKIARASGNVEIYRDSLTAYGDQLYFVKDSSFAELTGTPRAVQQHNNVTGDTLRLHFNEEQLEFVEVLGHAVAISPADSLKPEPTNRLEGKKMSLWIENQKVTQTLVEGNAIATYHIREKGEAKGLDKTSGDRLRVFFGDGRISRIRVEGGTQGEYIPQQLVENDSLKK